jgi:hypothetical protein
MAKTSFDRFMNDGTRVVYTVNYAMDIEGIHILSIERNGEPCEHRDDLHLDAMDAVAMHVDMLDEDEGEYGWLDE